MAYTTITAMPNNILINCKSTYLEEYSNLSTYVFGYHITIINQSKETVQLIERHWEITDATGHIEIVEGKGVIGKQPYIKPQTKFEYNSFCPLPTEFGFMQGHYDMLGEDGTRFQIDIPQFRCSIPNSAN